MRVHQPVVELQHRGMQLRHDDVLVVSLVADERAPGLAGITVVESGQVTHVGWLVQFEERPAQPELLSGIQVGLLGGPSPVEGVEIQPRRAEIDEGFWIVLLLQARRRVERDVVIDELAEVGVARRDPRILLIVVDTLVGLFFCRRRQRRVVLVRLRVRGHRAAEREQRLARPLGGGSDRNIRPNRPSKSADLVPS